MYQNYIFDFYGTIAEVETDENSREVWETMTYFFGYQGARYTSETLKAGYEKYVAKYMSRIKGTDYPDIDLEDVIYKLYKDADIKPNSKLVRTTIKAFRAVTTKRFKVYDTMIDTLETLKKNNNKVFLVDNGQRSFLMSELKLMDMKKFFDGIYISSDLGMKKPDTRVLEKLMEEHDLKKKDTILIGNDYEEDIKMANKAGIDSLYIHTDSSNRKVKEQKATYAIMDGKHSDILKVLQG